jgi:signal recognition particle subunit SRP68
MDIDLSKASQAQESAEPVSLSLFSLINQARNEHGMRQQDFQRYRMFCSTKLHRLRETMNKTHIEKKVDHHQGKRNQSTNKKQLSRKQKLKAQSAAVQSANSKGKGHVFVRKSIAVEEVKNDR